MATYFHGNSSEIQTPSDGLQTLIFMNPSGYVPYSDTPPPPPPPTSQPTNNSLFFYDSSSNSLSHAPPLSLPSHSSQHLVGIPLSAATGLSTPDSNSQFLHHPHHHLHSDISALHGFVPRVHYNLWNQDTAARENPRAQQGLSLSLSSQQHGFGSIRGDREVPSGQSQAMAAVVSGEDMRVSGGSPSSISGISGVTNGVSGIQGVLLSSKYLKAAQELLEEVVKVGNGIISEFCKKGSGSKTVAELSPTAVTGGNGSVDGDEGNEKKVTELSTAERQEAQMKKAKLINMLDEVEQRYRQYHHQMQIVISSFEQAAGLGSARAYTSLALQTISKQFRCLKDAITGQIRVANKSLGEEDCNGGKIEGSRLKYVDHQLRQQRALQQLGMMQQNAWRPQRGLPERSVSVLRAWLFEHFLHPYPKDSDKHMLAKQTGLTRSQVSNWFINARVRLWKPMVEEMYVEEIKEQEQNGTGEKMRNGDDYESKSTGPSQVKSPTTENQTTSTFSSIQENSTNHQHLPSKTSFSTPSTSPNGENTRTQSGFSLIGSSDLLEGITQGSPKKPRNSEMMQSPNSFINMDVKPSSEVNNDPITPVKFNNIERQERDEYSFMGIPNNFIGGFGQYPIGEIGRFDTEQFTRFSGNSVSLTLGLPHCENLSLSGAHQNFLPSQNIQLGRRVDIGEPNHHDFGGINNSTPHSSAGFESINIQNRKGFAAQLLPDFVT